MHTAWVYLLRCSDGSYYCGSTTDLETRIHQHQRAVFKGYTSKRFPVTLVFCCEFPDIMQAKVVEHQIKGWSREKKEALIAGNFSLLHDLAQCRNDTHYRNANRGASKTTNDPKNAGDVEV